MAIGNGAGRDLPNMIRVLRPLDLPALAGFHKHASGNLARSRDLLAAAQAEPGTAGLLLADWRVPARRRTWIATEGRRPIGLVSIRRGSLPASWEIDRLILPADDRLIDICGHLLRSVSLNCSNLGIQRLYLRLPADHPVVKGVAQAGFVWYGEELVLHYQHPVRDRVAEAPDGLRQRVPADDHGIYRLYNQTVPARVRQSEAVTFQEWLATARLVRHAEQWILESLDGVEAWLRVGRRGRSGSIEALYSPAAAKQLPDLLAFAIGRLAGQTEAWGLVGAYQPELARLLLERGFDDAGRSAVFVKHLAARIPASGLVPARA